MPADAQADGLYVLSDLHLAPPGEQSVFAAHAPLVALLDEIAASPSPQWLVLNGDVFDFLQIPGYEQLSLPLAPQRMAGLLDALAAEPRERNVVQALQRLTAAGHTLCCLPGNHDAELNLFSVQEVLAQRIGSSQVLPAAAGVWRLEVTGRRVVGVHGHHDDAFNAIGGDTLLRAQSDGDATATMPPGSRLVCEVINPYRRAKTAAGTPRFPFVDLLPSDRAVVLAPADGMVRRLLWRALGSALEAARDAFRPQVPDELARQVMAGWGREVVAITGHTHAAKTIATAAGGTYINTGTWLDLVPMPASTSVAEVQAWLAKLQRNEVPRWQGCPVARVDADGARLLQWTGTALRPRAEGLPN
jgi:UDP-2,3-diacylglucosamine pyrophosphatase LpxH